MGPVFSPHTSYSVRSRQANHHTPVLPHPHHFFLARQPRGALQILNANWKLKVQGSVAPLFFVVSRERMDSFLNAGTSKISFLVRTADSSCTRNIRSNTKIAWFEHWYEADIGEAECDSLQTN